MSLVPLTDDRRGQKGRTRRPVSEQEKAILRKQKEKADYQRRNGYVPR